MKLVLCENRAIWGEALDYFLLRMKDNVQVARFSTRPEAYQWAAEHKHTITGEQMAFHMEAEK